MDWTIAILGALGALVIAYINTFLKEQYVRHLDANAIAAGLAGELSSYSEAWPIVRDTLASYLKLLDAGQRGRIPFRPFDRPKDVFFEANAGKLGVLGVDLVREVAFVYGNIGGFRVGFGLLQSSGADMSDDEFRARVLATISAIDRALPRGVPLLEALKARADAKFWSTLIRGKSTALTNAA